MEKEGNGNPNESLDLFTQAWDEANTGQEKLIAAHYLARQQSSVEEKLVWDKKALHHALQLQDDSINTTLPSLYLNISKCYEDLKQWDEAFKNYKLAEDYVRFLANDGYGNMIRSGIQNGLKRLADNKPQV